MPDPMLRIDADRFRAHFDELSAIGGTPEGGVNRPSFTDAHLEARRWFRARVEDLGLTLRTDRAGNHSGELACGPPGAPTLLLGSHLDSVPYGGRYDGALGVLAALEAVASVKEAGIELPVHLEAIDFSDEEGTLVGLLGSRALAGTLRPEHLKRPRGGRDAFLQALERAGLREDGFFAAARPRDSLAGFLELHIEQGTRLVESGADLGVVTSIAGIGSHHLTFVGRADHAGTTPLRTRRDAALGASAFVLAARELALASFPDCMINVGVLSLEPGAFNIVPSQARLGLELRAPDEGTYKQLDQALLELAQEQASRFGNGLEIEALEAVPPTPLSPLAQDAIRQAAAGLGLQAIDLFSGAGHDAMVLAEICPAGMIFVPSAEGASHSALEFTPWESCVQGANALLQAALALAEATPEMR